MYAALPLMRTNIEKTYVHLRKVAIPTRKYRKLNPKYKITSRRKHINLQRNHSFRDDSFFNDRMIAPQTIPASFSIISSEEIKDRQAIYRLRKTVVFVLVLHVGRDILHSGTILHHTREIRKSKIGETHK